MPRRKLTVSEDLRKANARAAALQSIDPALDLGSGLTLTAYKAQINTTEASKGAYNTLLSQVDVAYNALLEDEKKLADLSERMLAAVAGKYGKNSNEYEMAGGTRKSERAKRERKAKA